MREVLSGTAIMKLETVSLLCTVKLSLRRYNKDMSVESWCRCENVIKVRSSDNQQL
jgi:hypothetical protein